MLFLLSFNHVCTEIYIYIYIYTYYICIYIYIYIYFFLFFAPPPSKIHRFRDLQ